MKKFLARFLMLLLVLAVLAPVAHSFPSMQMGGNELYYTNREAVFRADQNGDYQELDYTNPDVVPQLQVGDILVGILNVQNIDMDGETYWYNNGEDQLSGIFAQEITGISPIGVGVGGFSVRVDLGVASTDTFTTLGGDTFTSGLSGNEMVRMYADSGPGATVFNDHVSIPEGIARATDGTEWLTLEMDPNANDYAFSHITPLATGVGQFDGESWLGLSISEFYDSSAIFPLVADPEVGLEVDFYANSELEGNDDFIAYNVLNDEYVYVGDSPWVFESNDPAFMHVVPEPGTFFLFGIGLLGLSSIARRKK